MPDMNLPAPVAELIETVVKDLTKPYDWKCSAAMREAFREKVYSNNSKAMTHVPGPKIRHLLDGIVRRFETALRDSVDPESGLLHTYYSHQPVDVRERTAKAGEHKGGFVPLEITRFMSEPLPLFLEGQVHWLRVCTPDTARQVYYAVRKSPLLDKSLQMYKLNECLERCSPEIGRARTFSRGWFENESIWLHMSTKYLLELVKQGLHEEFYRDAETMLVPFMDPQVYGRSILENSSFIASSDCPEPSARGRGFVARLSGTTAEFIHLWRLLTVGKQPFTLQEGQLTFALEPVLPGKWFTEAPRQVFWRGQQVQIPANAFACALLADILVVYQNPQRLNTYGADAAHIAGCRLDDVAEVEGPQIRGHLAEQIRQRAVRRIDVWLK
jgi:hypothetical protein